MMGLKNKKLVILRRSCGKPRNDKLLIGCMNGAEDDRYLTVLFLPL